MTGGSVPVCPVCLSGESRLALTAIQANYPAKLVNWAWLPEIVFGVGRGVITVGRTRLDSSGFVKG